VEMTASTDKVKLLLTLGIMLCTWSPLGCVCLVMPPLLSVVVLPSLLLGRFLFLEQLHQPGVPSCYLILYGGVQWLWAIFR
jgi:hypothetical protein